MTVLSTFSLVLPLCKCRPTVIAGSHVLIPRGECESALDVPEREGYPPLGPHFERASSIPAHRRRARQPASESAVGRLGSQRSSLSLSSCFPIWPWTTYLVSSGLQFPHL